MTTTETPDSRRRCLVACIVTALALTLYACGSVSDPNAGDPDAGSGGGGDGGNLGPEIISITPADGAQRVSVLSDVAIEVTTSLDPATIDGTSVVLRNMAGEIVVNGDVSYDDGAKQIVFTPSIPLLWGATYELALSSVTDPDGFPLADTTVTFQTYRNPMTRTTNYSRTEINHYWNYINDADGFNTRVQIYDEPGGDDTWMTSDDVMSSYVDYEYDDGRWVAGITHPGPGPDQQWFTADDEISAYSVTDWGERGLRTAIWSYNGPGNDGEWRTGDDELNVVTGYEYDDGGHLVEMKRSSAPGSDGVHLTDDDTYDFTWSWDFDADGRQVKWYAYGADGALTTHRSYTYDSNGALLGYVYYNNPGADQTWLTADDGIQNHYAYQLTPERLNARFIYYAGTGPDEDWLTSDDTMQSHTEYSYDSLGNRTATDWHNDPGTDGQWLTDDDIRYNGAEYDTSL
jgi:hypothetical protein